MTGLHLLFGGIALFWVTAGLKAVKGRRDAKWRLGPDAPVAPELPRLIVVIPARNEAANIGPCVAALRASDHPNLTIRVLDDGSTDGTAALAAAAGAEVVQGGGAPLPEGWKGKPWALQRATRDLDADWLVFVDADVRVHPAALSRIHTRALATSYGVRAHAGTCEQVRSGAESVEGGAGVTLEGPHTTRIASTITTPAAPLVCLCYSYNRSLSFL
jgi:hypothetical protein